MDQKLRTIIITGASRGLGLELSKSLIEDGKHQVILTSVDEINLQLVCKEISQIYQNSKTIDYHVLDVTNPGSVQVFKLWFQEKYKTIDVLINNAGIKDSLLNLSNKEEIAVRVLDVNLFGVIRVTESLIDLLSDDGKVLIITSELGKLHHQQSSIRKTLSNPLLVTQDIMNLASELVEMRRTGNLVGWKENLEPIYYASKALANAYGRFALTKLLKPNQSSFLIHPGWCQTNMGGAEAPMTPKEGIASMKYVIDKINFGRDQQYNAKFYDKNCSIIDF